MEADNLGVLEMQVEQLIKKYLDLLKENSILKQKLKSKEMIHDPDLSILTEIKVENDALKKKNNAALKKLKDLLQKLEIDAVSL
jgi:cell division septum initiation protein DivIVA